MYLPPVVLVQMQPLLFWSNFLLIMLHKYTTMFAPHFTLVCYFKCIGAAPISKTLLQKQ